MSEWHILAIGRHEFVSIDYVWLHYGLMGLTYVFRLSLEFLDLIQSPASGKQNCTIVLARSFALFFLSCAGSGGKRYSTNGFETRRVVTIDRRYTNNHTVRDGERKMRFDHYNDRVKTMVYHRRDTREMITYRLIFPSLSIEHSRIGHSCWLLGSDDWGILPSKSWPS